MSRNEIKFSPVRLLFIFLSWLKNLGFLRNFLSLQKEREVVFSIIGEMYLSNIHCIISKVIMNDERLSITVHIEL
jgi:hypothetical protein